MIKFFEGSQLWLYVNIQDDVGLMRIRIACLEKLGYSVSSVTESYSDNCMLQAVCRKI